ncbi:NAD(P)H-dependent oxidoreductase [Jannaschia aquimarina]|uniref:AzoR_1 protein n=1 Tax=Jannaschia aquimarina TaxID=935700 RepID=A0A0D1EHN6_9RHOB|nr:NAD(P)H-dependent oxidoreductase [Jannaschia aquimarina]KIT17189.1 FMN-dependent NADH-azoreductase [Jannaschia aquimarina]SNT18106.1 Putative NADPH-quinone reductase (modulator of drug activity B) [Jannaschia aquimarina]
MTGKRIFILNGHPGGRSLSRAFADAYADRAAAAGHDVRVAHLEDLAFDMDFGGGGYSDWKPLEPALEGVMRNIEWAEHIVIATPMWWGGMPAKLKGLFDRILLPGRGFDTRVTKMGMPTPMLGGRTARVIVTSDTPGWYLRLVHRNAMLRQIGGHVLGFVGIRPTRFTYFAGATDAAPGRVAGWVERVARLGAAGA